MESICCVLNLFEKNQNIYKYSSLTDDITLLANKPIQDFARTIASQCHNLNINKVHLYGDALYLEPIVEDIKTLGKLEYSCDDIIVEVN